ncbi:MAG: hypothetical protein LBJ71_02660 [Holosporaceae bacterium]|jgi:hypothetical protein|nr:hypothetical protein [Holosporaceae bacterium]
MKHFLFLLLAVGFSVDASSKYFEVDDIEIKQSGKNSLIAKQIALSSAMLSAFKKALAEELRDKSIVASISLRQIRDCVYDYSIDQEKVSDSVYIGKFSYRFSKKKVASLLRSYGVNIKIEDEEEKKVKLAVYRNDFLRHASKLRELGARVKQFSDERVVFCINKDRLANFYRLRISYAPLT